MDASTAYATESKNNNKKMKTELFKIKGVVFSRNDNGRESVESVLR